MDRKTARKISLIYGTCAAAWILLTGFLPALWRYGDTIVSPFEIEKGIAFVAATTILLYLLLVRLGRAEQSRYRALFQANPHPMWVYDLDSHKFLAVNDAAIARYGYSKQEFLAMSISSISPVDDIPCLLDSVGRARHTGHLVDSGLTKHRLKDGSLIDVEVTSHVVPFNGYRARLVLANDVTERLAAQTRLEESERRYRAIIEQSIAGIFILDNHRISFVNRRAGEILGYPPEELTGQDLGSVIAGSSIPQLESDIRQLMSRQADVVRNEFECRRKDGTIITIGAHGVAAEILGSPVIIGMFQDITATRRAEDKARDYAKRLEETLLGTLDIVSRMIELRDPYTAGHEHRVGELSAAIAAEMGLDAGVQQGLRIAGAVHDVGKIMVPSEILTKPGRISPLEYQLVQEHAQKGFEILRPVDFPWPVAEVARQHHERFDGSGYPRGLKGEAILMEARIVAVADVIESMAAHRPYRAGLGLERALTEIEKNSGRLYDPAVAASALRLFRERGYTMPD
jgi:PAS domain S-box-containing protein